MAQVRKLIVHVVGFLTALAGAGILGGRDAALCTGLVGFLSAILLYWVPNAPIPPPPVVPGTPAGTTP